MATYTTNYKLEKPAQTDIYNVDVFNANADKIDAALTDKAETTMLAPVETTNHASRAYAVGEYFVFNGYLCRATAAIASGGTIAIGTNCASTAAGTELTAIKESLSTLSGSIFPFVSSVSGNSSKTFTIENNSKVLFLLFGYPYGMGIIIARAVADGTVDFVDIPTGTTKNYTVTKSTRQITISNSSGGSINVHCMTMP